MRNRRTTREYGLNLNMTPLIDVVFLLLVFFLVASQFAQVEYQQRVELPDAESGEAGPQLNRQRLVVHVGSDESLTVAGQLVDAEGFDRQLRELLAGSSPEAVEVRIRGDRSVPFRVIEPLLVTCARSRVWRVNFAVLRTGKNN